MRTSSMWTIAIVGVIGFAVVCLFMLVALRGFQTTEAGNRAKLANSIRERFQQEATIANIREEDGKHVLRVEYQTTKDSGMDMDVQDAEMVEVANFAIQTYTGKVEREEIREIHVVRHELRGSGCFRNTYTNSLAIKNPLLEEKSNPWDFDD